MYDHLNLYIWTSQLGYITAYASSEHEARYHVICSLDHTGLTNPDELLCYIIPSRSGLTELPKLTFADYKTIIRSLTYSPDIYHSDRFAGRRFPDRSVSTGSEDVWNIFEPPPKLTGSPDRRKALKVAFHHA